MTELVQIPKEFRHEFAVDAKGNITASIRATARLAEKKASGLSDSFKSSVQQKPRQLAKYLMEYGFDGVQQNSWNDNGVPGVAVNRILLYYAYECQQRYRSEQAKKLCDAFQKYGFDKWFQQQLGWQPEVKPEKPMTTLEILEHQFQLLKEHDARLNKQEAVTKKLTEAQQNDLIIQQETKKILDKLTIQNEFILEYIGRQIEVNIRIRQSLIAESDLCDRVPPNKPLRKKVRRCVLDYCALKNKDPDIAWNKAYDELEDLTGFRAKAIARNKGNKTILDAVDEKPGMMDRLHEIVSSWVKDAELDEIQRQQKALLEAEAYQEVSGVAMIKMIDGTEFKVGDEVYQR